MQQRFKVSPFILEVFLVVSSGCMQVGLKNGQLESVFGDLLNGLAIVLEYEVTCGMNQTYSRKSRRVTYQKQHACQSRGNGSAHQSVVADGTALTDVYSWQDDLKGRTSVRTPQNLRAQRCPHTSGASRFGTCDCAHVRGRRERFRASEVRQSYDPRSCGEGF